MEQDHKNAADENTAKTERVTLALEQECDNIAIAQINYYRGYQSAVHDLMFYCFLVFVVTIVLRYLYGSE